MEKRICQDIVGSHKFFACKAVSEYAPSAPSFRTVREGMLVACAMCGEVRKLWEDGEIEIVKKGKYIPE